MPTVLFIPDLKRVEVAEGTNLIEAAESANVLIDASCNGVGVCGTCKVKIVCGEDIPLSEHEIEHLSDAERAAGFRLACQISVNQDMEVTVPATHGGSGRKKKMVNLPEGFTADANVRTEFVKVKKAKLDYQVNDLERIREHSGIADISFAPGVLPSIHPALDAERGNVTIALDGSKLLAIETGDSSNECYGIAFDIGTTTVVGMLWNLATGELVDVEARTNYQSLYGADVISRIQYTLEHDNGLHVLQTKVVQCFNDILDEICERSEINPLHIYDATIVGNTTMSHLCFGVTPRSMSRTPFAPVFCEAQDMQARELGVNINPCANMHLLPNIAGHVGSDIVGMMLTIGADSLSGSHVAIDIGTNGEVVAVKDGKMMCCSTAAGPAFEGATIRHGMRAAAGAIERVRVTDGDIEIDTIDDAQAVGICGSGLIDAVAVLLETGVVDDLGKMVSKEEALQAGIPEAIANRIVGSGLDAYFILAPREGLDDIVLTQNDIREVQLAKGAILAGIQTLMKILEIPKEELDSIKLAGAFGNYIDKRSALRIGLLPQIDEERIVSVGNAAGVGSCMALINKEERAHADAIARATTHVELSRNEDFQDFYIMAMTFKLD